MVIATVLGPSFAGETRFWLSRKDSDAGCTADRLFAWATAMGIRFKKIGLKEFEVDSTQPDQGQGSPSRKTRRGVVAIERIKQGEAIIEVPYDRCLIQQNIQRGSHPVQLAVKSDVTNPELPRQEKFRLGTFDYLALYLLHEKHDAKSEIAPYVCMLPKQSSTLLWDDRRLEQQTSQELRSETKRLLQVLRQNFEVRLKPFVKRHHAMLRVSENPGVINFPEYLWAIDTVRSRNFGMPGPMQINMNIIPPVIDFVNHQTGSLTTFQLTSRSNISEASSEHSSSGTSATSSEYSFSLVAGSDINAGEEVFVDYGKACNDRMLLVYGFSIPDNRMKDCSWDIQRMVDIVTEDDFFSLGPRRS